MSGRSATIPNPNPKGEAFSAETKLGLRRAIREVSWTFTALQTVHFQVRTGEKHAHPEEFKREPRCRFEFCDV